MHASKHLCLLALCALAIATPAVAFAQGDPAASGSTPPTTKTEVVPVESSKPAVTANTRVTLQITKGGAPMGKIVLKLFPNVAPKACENFVGLAKKGYYDGIIFHRVMDNFMIQGGDPTGTGYSGKSLWGTPFEDEFSPTVRFTKAGQLAMANSGPKTNGSQFFITLKGTPHLNDRHTIFGEVVEGMDIVTAIGKVETNPQNNKPVAEIAMKQVTVQELAPQ
jgi:peptidylprolyl isomerase